MLDVTMDNFEGEVIESNQLVLVDFKAEWCAPCKAMSSVLEQLQIKHPHVKIVKVDVDSDRELATKYSVRSLPTFIFFKNGNIVDKVIGTTSGLILSTKFNKLLNPNEKTN
jgi:thioredoxin 1